MSALASALSAPVSPDARALDAGHADALLDEALSASFPASDPPAIFVPSDAPAPASQVRERPTVRPLDAALAGLLADLTALWFRTKGFHWHVSGPSFRELDLLFDAQADQILAAVDPVAERLRKRNARALSGLEEVAALSPLAGETDAGLAAAEMVRRLLDDHRALLARLAAVRRAAEAEGDEATASKVDDWTDEAEERAWFLRATLAEG